MSPDKVRHEDVTFQVPTTLPPQGETLGQLMPLPPVLVDPPVLVEPPVLVAPPVLVEPPVLVPPPVPPVVGPEQPGASPAAANAKVPTSPRYPFRMITFEIFPN